MEKGVRMTWTYTHLNDEHVAIAIYEANGLKAPVRKEMRKSKDHAEDVQLPVFPVDFDVTKLSEVHL